MTTLKLSKPIKAFAKEVTELEFKEPTGEHIRRCGLPFSMTSDAYGADKTDFNTANAAKLIAATADIPPTSVDQLSPKDFLAATMIVTGFFGDSTSQTSSSTAITSSPGSSEMDGSGK